MGHEPKMVCRSDRVMNSKEKMLKVNIKCNNKLKFIKIKKMIAIYILLLM